MLIFAYRKKSTFWDITAKKRLFSIISEEEKKNLLKKKINFLGYYRKKATFFQNITIFYFFC